ncbi:4743_t:CDS:2, partial [Racocetra fulgida]
LLILHNSNMVHRDLHPKNILSDQERWFLSDFGLCGPIDKNQTNICGHAKELFNHFDKMLEQIGNGNIIKIKCLFLFTPNKLIVNNVLKDFEGKIKL